MEAQKAHNKMRRDRKYMLRLLKKLDKYFSGGRLNLWHLEANAQADLFQIRQDIKGIIEYVENHK